MSVDISYVSFATPTGFTTVATISAAGLLLPLGPWAIVYEAEILLAAGEAPNSFALYADSGSYATTGYAAQFVVDSVEEGFTLEADPGTYAMAGATANMLVGTPATTYTMTGDPAQYKTIGQAALFKVGILPSLCWRLIQMGGIWEKIARLPIFRCDRQ